MLGCLKYLEDALLGDSRGEDDGEVGKGSHALAYGTLESPDGHGSLVFHQVPLVDHHHQALVVFLYQLEDVHVLRLYAPGGIYHEYADIAILYGADGAHHRVELQVFRHLVLATDARGVHQVEVEAELVIPGVDAVSGGARYLGHDIAILTYEGVDDAALARIGPAHHGKTGNVFLQGLFFLGGEFLHHQVQQLTCSATVDGADTHGIAQAQLVELGCLIIKTAIVYLVGHEYHWQFCTTKDFGHISVKIGDARRHVHKEEQQVGFLRGHQHLLANSLLEDVV